MKDEYRDILLTTKVSVSRNLQDKPFPARAGEEQNEELIKAVAPGTEALGMGVRRFQEGEKETLMALYEKGAIPRDFVSLRRPRALLSSADGRIVLAVSGEDHYRLTVKNVGGQPEEALQKLKDTENTLWGDAPLAFDEKLGYLTASPSNLGCAMRVEMLLHLPALAESGRMERIILNAERTGVSLDGLYSEGANPPGDLYILSNRMTLGLTEEEILNQVAGIAEKLAEKELELRTKALEQNRLRLEDRAARAGAILKNARLIGYNEAMLLLSDYRLGMALGLAEGDKEKLLQLTDDIQPYTLWKAEDTSEAQRDARRATLLRETL